jgi:hypothetical protein
MIECCSKQAKNGYQLGIRIPVREIKNSMAVTKKGSPGERSKYKVFKYGTALAPIAELSCAPSLRTRDEPTSSSKMPLNTNGVLPVAARAGFEPAKVPGDIHL